MTYLKVATNSLVDLTGRNSKESIDWESIGTNAKAINLSPIRNQIADKVTNVSIYLLPVVDSAKAELFTLECAKYGVSVEIITQVDAEKVLTDNFVAKEVK